MFSAFARSRRHDQAGTTLIEYALVLSFLVAVCVSVLTYVGSATADQAGKFEDALEPTTTSTTAGGATTTSTLAGATTTTTPAPGTTSTTCPGGSGGRGGGSGRNCR